jgi:hypothetical protein
MGKNIEYAVRGRLASDGSWVNIAPELKRQGGGYLKIHIHAL